MTMRFILAALACASVATAFDWGARLNKPAIDSALGYVEDGLQRYLPEITFTTKKWENNLIPSL